MKKRLFTFCCTALFVLLASAQTDITSDYLTNPSFEADAASCTQGSGITNNSDGLRGWNISPSGWNISSPGTSLIISADCYTDNNFGKTTIMDGSYAFYQRFGWGSANSELKQTSKKELPAGEYELTFYTKAYAANNAATTSLVKVLDASSSTLESTGFACMAGSNSIMSNSEWVKQTIPFVLSEASAITISAQMTWGNGGSCIAYDHFTLTRLPEGSIDPNAPEIEGGTEDELTSPTEGTITHEYVDEATMQQDLLQMIANSMQYAKNIWFSCQYTNSVNEECGYFKGNSAGQNNEDGVRTNADFSMLTAFMYKYGKDKVTLPTGMTWDEIKAMAMKSLVFGYSTHKANKLKVTSNQSYWGSTGKNDSQWESSLWTMSLAYASHFLKDELSDAQKTYIYNMIKAECDYELQRSIPTGFSGDTKSEENGWEADVLACALGLYPDDPLASQWFDRLRAFAINSYSHPSDANDNTVIDPEYDNKTVRDLYVGANLYNDYTLQNHNYFHTSYQNVVIQELGEAALALKMFQGTNQKWKTNALMHHNQDVMDHVLRHLALADGELAMPNGNDWSMFLYDQITSYSTLACFLRDPDALLLENMAYKHIKARQSTTNDGSWLLNSDIGPRRMGVEGHRVMMTYLMHEMASTNDLEPTSWSDFSKENENAYLFSTQNIVRANTPDRFSVFSWSGGLKSYTGYIASNRPDMNKIIVPYKANNTGNLLGWYTISGKGTNASPTANGIYELNGNSYTMNGQLNVNDAALLNNFSVYSTPGNAFIYMDYVVSNTACTITGEYGGLLAISVDPFTKEKRTLYHAKGRIQSDGSSLKTFNSNWVNIDNEVGIINTGNDNQVGFGDRQLSNSVYIARLYPSYSSQARTVAANEIVDRRHIIYYNNVDAATTATMSVRCMPLTEKVPAGWNGVIACDPDSARYMLLSNFMGENTCDLSNILMPEGAPVFTEMTAIDKTGASVAFTCEKKRSIANTLRLYVIGNDLKAFQEEGDSCAAYIYNNQSAEQQITITAWVDGTKQTLETTLGAANWIYVKACADGITATPTELTESTNPLLSDDFSAYIMDAQYEDGNSTSAWKGSPAIGGYANNRCAEKWNTTFNVYQKLTGLPNGRYKIIMQGFYRCGGYADAANKRKNGTESLNAQLYANDASLPIMSIFEEASSEKMNGPSCVITTYGLIPNQMTDASVAFSNGLYTQELEFDVTDGTATIGIKKESNVSNDWCIFDNFQLFRLTKDYTLQIKENGWATFMLPFTTQIPEALSFYSCRETNGDVLILESASNITANVPYIVNGKEGEYTFSGIPTTTELIFSEGLLTGTFKDLYAPKNSYVLQEQNSVVGFYRVDQDDEILVSANHAYLLAPEAASNTNILTFPEETGIQGVHETDAGIDVYSMDGVLLRKDAPRGHELDGLPSGGKLYIIGNKKVLKR